jgi:glycosyltransferase involved in cell wall biosynthesis
MKLAYLLNSYPMTSTTFIRREIEAIERAGVAVKRFGVRHWDEALVDPADRAEQGRTEYLLTGNLPALLLALPLALLTRPRATWSAVSALRALIAAARGGIARHVNYWLQAIHLRNRCAALGITHIHAHFSTNAAAVAMLCRLMGGPSYSFTVHGPDELMDPTAGGLAIKAAHARHVLAISDYCRRRIVEAIPGDLHARIAIVPCGIEPAAYATTAPPAGSDLVCVGRLSPQKGQAEIPAAIALVNRDDLRILLAGDGETRETIVAESKRCGVAGQMTLLGWQDNDAVRRLLGESRALLLPSHAEGLPIVIMEAFASGRPVIATTVAGIPELVDDACGWLYRAGSPEGLAGAIAAAIDASPEQLAVMGAEGRHRVTERHDIDKIAPRLIALFGG